MFSTTYLVESINIDRRPRLLRRFRAHESQLKPFRVREDRAMVQCASRNEFGADEEWTDVGDDDGGVAVAFPSQQENASVGGVAIANSLGADALSGSGIAVAGLLADNGSFRASEGSRAGERQAERSRDAGADLREAGRHGSENFAGAGSFAAQCLPQNGPPDPQLPQINGGSRDRP